MNICVIATASAYRGALVIYKQFLGALSLLAGDDIWHVFVDNNMPMPSIPNVHYHVCHTKGLGRIWFDLFGFKKYCKNNGITPDVVFSLQNTGVKCRNNRNVIYYHQSLPLYHYQIKLFSKSLKENLFYNYFYPLYVNFFFNKHTYVAVQTETIKRLFAKKYKFPQNKIGVYFPKVEKIKVDDVKSYQYEPGTYNFLYPAMGASYKEHMTLAYALKIVMENNPQLACRIRVHLTVNIEDLPDLVRYAEMNGMQSSFVFHGNLPHDQILSMLKSGDGLVFPSVVETLGLPLIEAASLGSSIIANDMGYVHDALNNYTGVKLVKVHDYDGWASAMISCCEDKSRYAPYVVPQSDSWERMFKLIKEGVIS